MSSGKLKTALRIVGYCERSLRKEIRPVPIALLGKVVITLEAECRDRSCR